MNFWKLSTFALLAALVTTHAVPLAAADKQPLMRGALVNMKKAHVQLKKATHDKGGHRVKAIQLLEASMAEVEAGIKFDNQN